MNFADFVFFQKKKQKNKWRSAADCFLWSAVPLKDNDLTSRAAWLEMRKQLFPAAPSFICVRVLRDLKRQAGCLGAMLIKQEGDFVHFTQGPWVSWGATWGGSDRGSGL